MTFRFKPQAAVMGTACAVLLAGCGGQSGYFKVRDPGVETSYYTTKIATSRGAVKFKDEQTGDAVTLQSSAVRKISKPEFMKGATTPAPAPAAAAPAPAPVSTSVLITPATPAYVITPALGAYVLTPAPAATVGAQMPVTPAAAGASAPPAVR